MIDTKYDPVTQFIHSLFVKVGEDMDFTYPHSLINVISNAVEIAQGTKIYDSWDIKDLKLEQLVLVMEIIRQGEHNRSVNICRRCGKPFFTSRRSNYCSRVGDDGVRCHEAAKVGLTDQDMSQDKPQELYNAAYAGIYKRYQKGKLSKDAFNTWHTTALSKLEQVRNYEITLIEFEKWLRSQ